MVKFFSSSLVCTLVLSTFISRGQDVPIGQWKDYISYRQGFTVCQGQSRIYCVSGSGMFSYNTQDNSIERYNKVTGLSDVSPSVARYNPYCNALVIGYPNGNIDVLQNGRIINIPDLKNSLILGSKVINNIYFYSAVPNTAYISCGQGILQVDLSQDIILNTFYIGTSGSALNVHNITVFNDTIFAATDSGIYKIAFNDPNPNDYSHWKHITSPLPPGKYNAIASMGDSLFVNYSNPIYGKDTLFVYSMGKWKYSYVKGGDIIRSMEPTMVNGKNYLVVCKLYNAVAIDAAGNQPISASGYVFGPTTAYDAILDANLNLWIADVIYGLVESSGFGNDKAYDPPGPYSNKVTSIAAADNSIWITPGGYDGSFGPLFITNVGVSTYQNGTWGRIVASPDTLSDITYVALDPNNSLHAFAGSWGHGVIEYNNNSITNVYNPSNSSLVSVPIAGYYSVRVGGMAFDTLGNLWVSNSLAETKYLSVKKTDGSWQAFDFSGSSFLTKQAQVTQVLITQGGAKWMLLPNTGILVYQDNGTFVAPNSINTILINTQKGNGKLPSVNINTMAIDKNGSIWVGTDATVSVFYSPDNVLDGNHDWDADSVYVTQNGYTQVLMQNQVTTAIAVDGANRKWIGTQSGGVFLMSADGTQQINNFTSSNSPLLSNTIQCITINQSTGEVFFGTDKGIVSYRGTATEGGSQFGNVYAFPNPVPHGYSGPIAIKGLVTNTDIKITTINGELVYHTNSLGGQAIWYGTNFDGRRVQTGIYLVFCASPDGNQTQIAKLLFIN